MALKKKTLLSSGKPPIYDRSSLNLTTEELNHNLEQGKKPHWRFKLEDKIIKPAFRMRSYIFPVSPFLTASGLMMAKVLLFIFIPIHKLVH